MKIYKAISDKDVTHARKFMIEHLINAEREIKLSVSQKKN
jgi:DNA-binding FadR family transcriptional regulator